MSGKGSKFHKMRGAVFYLALLFITVFLSLIGLITEGGRLVRGVREAQSYVDAAALAAMTEIQISPNNYVGWSNSKKASLAILKSSQPPYSNNIVKDAIQAETMRYTSGAETMHDPEGYEYDTASVEGGNVSITVERGLLCYNDNTRVFMSLEALGGCNVVNAVRVTINISDISSIFGALVGSEGPKSIRASAISAVRGSSIACNSPTCASFDTDPGTEGIQLSPSCSVPSFDPPAPTPAPSPDPLPTTLPPCVPVDGLLPGPCGYSG